MSNDNLPRNKVIQLYNDPYDRNKQIISLEKDGYFLKQISAYGTQNSSGCYGWFQKKNIRNKKSPTDEAEDLTAWLLGNG